MFIEERCNLCGECLTRCPEMRLSGPEAAAEIQRLISGEESQHVLSRCSSCFSCETFCPQNCHPYHLVLQRWNDLYENCVAQDNMDITLI